MQDFRRIILDNGLRLILVPQPGNLAATVAVAVEAGSKYETKEINGLSHFLEHTCFKGTTKRPRAIDISSELDGMGANYNAFTSQEMTAYHVKARKESLEKVLDVIADVYLNPVFDPKEIDKERGVITEEINMIEDTPQRRIHDFFMELVYGDQPAGWDVAGRKEVIARLTREDLMKYRSEHYIAPATTVVVSGGFDEKGIEKKIAGYFSGLKDGKKSGKVPVHESQDKPAELIKTKDSDQTHLVMGFRAFSLFDKRRFALEVLADILGSGFSSRLWQKIREEMGAAYYVRASADLYSDHGLIEMWAGVDHKKLEDVIKASLEGFARFRDEKVGEAELERAKEHLVGNLFLSLETSDELAFYYGLQEIQNLPILTPDALAKEIKAVSAEDIQSVARDLFRNEGLNFAVIGPFKEKSFSDILKI
ncbi:MAG: Peptidase M16 domain protein [Candidatus Jorgensenbacteria bacterium GW2011_GWA1_48_13]|uniref:Peptidase M16 domain protein n=1 Tax=Candidatus Jorgensenbacteria bacterium GW2011_GWB1_50_10 TaxID=1618665 RepID=A0A0G1YIG9_9BACT|nr:MAG: Peptidase M16 domain protein [Candidatus Jorgensenbacteria bacterium GW2011_GWA1_48_13]KKW14757.1 MAG: Peptidase M16 domain protein [Candidatus Jorgensenbacteria bacterium GW2011_GWB1_50_10]